MKVYTFEQIEIDGTEVPQGTFIDIPEAAHPELPGKVAYIKDGELRVPRYVENLEALIAGLTSDDLALQKQLLLRHCQAYDCRHIGTRWKEWENLVVSMELNEGICRDDAEVEAARKLNLLAFMVDRGKN